MMELSDQSPTREDILNKLKKIVLAPVSEFPVKVYLFGSWARQEERRTSDIDVAIWYEPPFPEEKIAEIRNEVAESIIPYNVDIVDLTVAGPIINEKVAKEGIVWKD